MRTKAVLALHKLAHHGDPSAIRILHTVYANPSDNYQVFHHYLYAEDGFFDDIDDGIKGSTGGFHSADVELSAGSRLAERGGQDVVRTPKSRRLFCLYHVRHAGHLPQSVALPPKIVTI